MSEKRILVTGARGFLGRTVCADLCEAGLQVRAMVRSGPLVAANYETVEADLHDSRSLRDAVADASAIVHLAARVHVMRENASDPIAAFRRVNVQGTQALIDEAVRAGVRRFIFISSVKAVGEQSSGAFTSETPCLPSDAYGIAKLEAEILVREIGNTTSLLTCILRLPLAYGPWMTGNMLRLFDWVYRERALPFAGVNNARSIVYSGNVAAAIRHMLQMETPPPTPLFVADSPDLSTPALIRTIASALGKRPRLASLPEPLLKAAAAGLTKARPLGLSSLGRALERLVGSLCVDPTELREATGVVLPYSTAEGMMATAEWYRTRLLTAKG